MSNSVIGKVHSFQTLGTVDGPGVRFGVFLQGCNLRCGCCHNPDTWEINGGNEYSSDDVFKRLLRYRDYFSEDGGITISGGEPLLQSKFVTAIFEKCREVGINTCLDTSGSLMSSDIERMLDFTDRVLLDIKYTVDDLYLKYVGCSLEKPLAFLKLLQSKGIKSTLRYVVIPTLNDNKESILRLKSIANEFDCVDKIELLPFKKICQVKYDDMSIPFRFAPIPEPKREDMDYLNSLLK